MQSGEMTSDDDVLRIEIEAPPEQVWDALVSEDALRDWFNDTARIEPRRGGAFAFQLTHGDEVIAFDGTISALDAPRRLAVDGAARIEFTLQPADDHTAVELRHAGFDQLASSGQLWDGDELIPLREYVTGIGPTH